MILLKQVLELLWEIRTKVRDHNGDLRDIINKYAPPVENPTKNYYNYLQQILGKDKVTVEDIPQLTKGIIEFENKPTEDMTEQKRLEAQGRLDKYLSPEIFNMAQRISQYDYPTGTTTAQMIEDLDTGAYRTQQTWQILHHPYNDIIHRRTIRKLLSKV